MSQDAVTSPKQLFNCHTHVFIGENIPPQIGKTFMFWPLYKLLTIPFILGICRWWYNNRWSPYTMQFTGTYKRIRKVIYDIRMVVRRTWLRFIVTPVNFLLVYHAVIYTVDWWTKSGASGVNKKTGIEAIECLREHHLFYDTDSGVLKLIIVIITFIFLKKGRQLIVFLLKKFLSFLSILPDKKTAQFFARYINIGRFAYYESSKTTFSKLHGQYPAGTGFVLLPMDMEFMDAGKLKPKGQYGFQMDMLAQIKKANFKTAFPFVFIDPNRETVDMVTDFKNGVTRTTSFFKWTPLGEGKVQLDDCFIKDYIEQKKFNGFKIYPALGYFPFDRRLLALWKYAADNGLPITTHCIRGTIFYRGKKKKEWDQHPVFKEAMGKAGLRQLLLPEIKNVDFINNFTHPLNYLCLLEERLLRIIVSTADQQTKDLFGYQGAEKEMLYNLKHLKICFGHYGGEEEWSKYFENDRDARTSKIVTQPEAGIDFRANLDADSFFNVLEQIWKFSDWYSIISSMMLQYENVYADISYIIHSEAIVPLLKTTLMKDKIKDRVLFGTDFFVVRNHKSEKEMLADIKGSLTEEEFDLIARTNPAKFLRSSSFSPV